VNRDRDTSPVADYAAAQVSPPVPAASPGLLPLRTLGAHVVVSVGMQNQVGLKLRALHSRGHLDAPVG